MKTLEFLEHQCSPIPHCVLFCCPEPHDWGLVYQGLTTTSTSYSGCIIRIAMPHFPFLYVTVFIY